MLRYDWLASYLQTLIPWTFYNFRRISHHKQNWSKFLYIFDKSIDFSHRLMVIDLKEIRVVAT